VSSAMGGILRLVIVAFTPGPSRPQPLSRLHQQLSASEGWLSYRWRLLSSGRLLGSGFGESTEAPTSGRPATDVLRGN
jgi:hypothetical protein